MVLKILSFIEKKKKLLTYENFEYATTLIYFLLFLYPDQIKD